MKQHLVLASSCALLFACAANSSSSSSSTHDDVANSSEENFTAASIGLWSLDGSISGAATAGDIELLQIGPRNYASLSASASAATTTTTPTTTTTTTTTTSAEPTIFDPSTFGDLWRGGGGGTAMPAGVSLHETATASAPTPSDVTYTLSLSGSGDVLTLTSSLGRVLTYERHYQLYCVPTDRGIEATALLEMGKSPSMVGVNGDGVMFPAEGTYAATVSTDVLFQLRNYEVVSKTPDNKTITFKFAWSDMNKPMINGTVAIVGSTPGIAATPIQCERFTPSSNTYSPR